MNRKYLFINGPWDGTYHETPGYPEFIVHVPEKPEPGNWLELLYPTQYMQVKQYRYKLHWFVTIEPNRYRKYHGVYVLEGTTNEDFESRMWKELNVV